jgi:hypothetical protein
MGVKSFKLTGDISIGERKAVIQGFGQYKESAVLLCSSVGFTGINLACASVGICMVSYSRVIDLM